MRIWLDDIRPMPEGFDKHCKFASEVVHLLDKRQVTMISFDHDLGYECDTGYHVAKHIEMLVYQCGYPRIQWIIHSANPVGRANIEAAMNSCEKYWKNKGM